MEMNFLASFFSKKTGLLPLVEGGKGISISTGLTAGSWAKTGGIGTLSCVNADYYDELGNLIPVQYKSTTRRERYFELIAHAIKGGIAQARIARDVSQGQGLINMNVLWEMGGVEPILHGVLSQVKDFIHGVTCGAGMPYRLAEICAHYNVFYYPIVSSARAFRILWKRAYQKFSDFLGGVVYEDPWKAGGHNGISNSENPEKPEDPYPRVLALREVMRESGLDTTPIILAGGIWWLSEWKDWINNEELGPIAFQFGTRPLLTKESPISDAWKKKLLTLEDGDVLLNRFSPTGFYSSAVKNDFLKELIERSNRQVVFTTTSIGDHSQEFSIGRSRTVYLTPHDHEYVLKWVQEGYTFPMRTPDSTLIFVTPEKAKTITADQIGCMGCLSACNFSNWSQNEQGSTGKKPDPRSYCIQKTLQSISHDGDVENNLMFAGHNAYRFKKDPFYNNGFVPTVKELVDRIMTGY